VHHLCLCPFCESFLLLYREFTNTNAAIVYCNVQYTIATGIGNSSPPRSGSLLGAKRAYYGRQQARSTVLKL
jgi:hypothetical protein